LIHFYAKIALNNFSSKRGSFWETKIATVYW